MKSKNHLLRLREKQIQKRTKVSKDDSLLKNTVVSMQANIGKIMRNNAILHLHCSGMMELPELVVTGRHNDVFSTILQDKWH